MSTPKILIKKEDPQAVMPTKANPSDIGFDLTIISRDTIMTGLWHGRVMTPEVTVYDTGLIVEPDEGYYVEIVPRSSFSRSGYMLANSVGIIDPSYRGTLKVALLKTDKFAPEIPLPYKGFQLVVRKVENVNLVSTDQDLSSTSRGAGGFGSTGIGIGAPPVPVSSRVHARKNANRPNVEMRADPTATALPAAIQMQNVETFD